MILESLILVKDKGRANQVGIELAKRLGENEWYSTQTVAYSLLSLSKLYKGQNANAPLNFVYEQNGVKEDIKSSESVIEKRQGRGKNEKLESSESEIQKSQGRRRNEK